MNSGSHARCVCPDDGQPYLHGFYSLQPWDMAERRMLIHRLPFMDRMPTGAEPAELGLLEPETRRFEPLAETRAWNYQLGCMAHWVDGEHGEERVLYNDRRAGRFVAVMCDPAGGSERVFDSPVYTVDQNGRMAFGYDFARVQPLRPGYAYAGVPYVLREREAPADEGIMRINLSTGETCLILSYAALANAFPHKNMRYAPVFVSRLLGNADGRRIVLSFRFRAPADGRYYTCLVTADPDGGNLHRLAGFEERPAHFDWCGPDRLVVWLQPANSLRGGFYLIEDRTHAREPLAHGVLRSDGHCSFGADTRMMLLDSFLDANGMQDLLLFDRNTGNVTELGRFHMPPAFGWSNHGGDMRCDLHPCWNRRGDRVCFDSMHEGRRAVYITNVTHSISRNLS